MWTVKKKHIPIEAAERTAWLVTAQEVVAGKHRSETSSWKESLWIGLSCFKSDPEFKPALKILKVELEK